VPKQDWKPRDLDIYLLNTKVNKFQTGFQLGSSGLTRANSLGPRMRFLEAEILPMLRDWMDSYDTCEEGRSAFRRLWKYARQLIDLQTRLLIEQYMYERRGWWRTLVSGFRPLD
jgi:hypothetical protein